ncbi:MAG: hypothetical protein R3C05_19490 [Pirellulaceae bacterium]
MKHLTSLLVAIAWIAPCGADDPQIVVPRVYIKRIDDVAVAALKSGQLASIHVSEGDSVQRDQELAKLDDRAASIGLQQSQLALRMAQQKAEDQAEIELAENRLQQELQRIKERKIENSALHQQAENTFAVDAAEKASDVAKNELDRARRAREVFADSVSQSEIDGLTLAHQRARLDAQQAAFERKQDQMAAAASDESLLLHPLAYDELRLQLQQAQTKRRVATLEASQYEAAVEAARLELVQHQ